MDFQRNNLDRETSPYLHQHRDNPVHWQAWGPGTLDHARALDKPILLSVGYAACHWCHVMAHESFENAAIAEVMNRLFVNIKVDREERPDIDAIYQTALHLLGQQGGWPLTMFLTPDGEPFWGGTYFPSTPRYGRPGFTDVLVAIEDTYRNGREKVEQNRAALVGALARLSDKSAGGAGLSADAADRAAEALVRHVDMSHGGIGDAPKFPHAPGLELLWRAHVKGAGESYARGVLITADAMAEGGIYDHLGGGWARYSVDTRWLVPHFEKMLYDNAQLVELYSRLWATTGRELYRRRVEETVGWLQREMTTAQGAFCSSLDADSDDGHGHSEEGAFYVWDAAEVVAVLGEDAGFFGRHYDVTVEGNWEGHTILNRLDTGEPDAATEVRLAPLRQRLFEARAPRPRPGLDDKVLADWNGLMIRALARAGMAMGRRDWIAAARRALDHVATAMAEGDRLHHSARDGRTLAVAMLDDYSHMADAALALHAATGDETLLARARAWVAVADRHYWDARDGGYFFTADDAEALIVRTRTAIDNATPSGNGTMVGVNARLWLLTGEASYRERAEAICATFADDTTQNPLAHAVILLGMDLLNRPVQVVVVGRRGETATEALVAEAWKAARHDLVLQVVADGAALPVGHPATGKRAVEGHATAYVCVGPVCSLPVTTANDLARLLREA